LRLSLLFLGSTPLASTATVCVAAIAAAPVIMVRSKSRRWTGVWSFFFMVNVERNNFGFEVLTYR
jgi:hypothetical protein